VWGTARTADDDNIVWGTSDGDTIVWSAADDDNIVWGTADDDNIVWGTADDDNIVWGTADDDNIVWGTALRNRHAKPRVLPLLPNPSFEWFLNTTHDASWMKQEFGDTFLKRPSGR
jgi:hypothetical protein